MTWTRQHTNDGLPILEVYEGGGHITAIRGAPGPDGRPTYTFDAWGKGLGGFRCALGHYATAAEARQAVEEHAANPPGTSEEMPRDAWDREEI